MAVGLDNIFKFKCIISEESVVFAINSWSNCSKIGSGLGVGTLELEVFGDSSDCFKFFFCQYSWRSHYPNTACALFTDPLRSGQSTHQFVKVICKHALSCFKTSVWVLTNFCWSEVLQIQYLRIETIANSMEFVLNCIVDLTQLERQNVPCTVHIGNVYVYLEYTVDGATFCIKEIKNY